MNRLKFIPIVILFILIPWRGYAAAIDVASYEVIGTSSLSGDESEMKKIALEDGFRKAVARATKSIIPSKVFEADRGYIEWRIYNKAENYVVNYTIISKPKISKSKTGESVYLLPIEVHIALAPLKKELLKAGVLKEEDLTYKVILTILDPLSYKNFIAVKDKIKNMDVVKDISYISFYKGRFALLIDITSSTRFFRARLTEELYKRYDIAMTGQNTILLNNIRDESE